MLSSDSEGERQVAVSKIGGLLIRCGLDWHDFADRLIAPAMPPTAYISHRPRIKMKQTQDHRYRIAATDLLDVVAAIRDGAPLDGYERQFLGTMEERAARYAVIVLSPKQFAYLTGLLEEI
ncbi:hypothetical protein [Phyllobacterium sp. UNC302MFCol5.2]|uniref:hypothetical protein n=1 Tax=Phyllobacterium sp. UNC302MFCol5.2 TaxID=1449065 RepID=UPI0012DC7EC2|nr:hypothetical protein [Phyllobacterium sp. UNC302MFCol5.2]